MAFPHKSTEFKNDSDKSTQELWTEVKSGNRVAFAFLYDQYAALLFQYGKRFTVSDHLIEDVIHDVYVDLWKYKENITIKNSLKFYLIQCFRRNIIRKLELDKKYLHNEQNYPLSFDSAESHQEVLIADQSRKEKRKEMQLRLDCLSKRQREAIYLKFYQDLKNSEIAEIMSVSVESVYNLISKAISRIRKNK